METVRIAAVFCFFITTVVYIGLVAYVGILMKGIASKVLDMFAEGLKEENQDSKRSAE